MPVVLLPALLGAGALAGCARSPSPLDPSTRVGETPAAELVLVLSEPCRNVPGGAPRVRPNSAAPTHLLPAGRYTPQLEDGSGVYFASPAGVRVTEPAFRGSRELAGGIYVPRGYEPGKPGAAWEYLGDADGIHSREPLPQSCAFALVPAAES